MHVRPELSHPRPEEAGADGLDQGREGEEALLRAELDAREEVAEGDYGGVAAAAPRVPPAGAQRAARPEGLVLLVQALGDAGVHHREPVGPSAGPVVPEALLDRRHVPPALVQLRLGVEAHVVPAQHGHDEDGPGVAGAAGAGGQLRRPCEDPDLGAGLLDRVELFQGVREALLGPEVVVAGDEEDVAERPLEARQGLDEDLERVGHVACNYEAVIGEEGRLLRDAPHPRHVLLHVRVHV
mmetsp:Transcript_58305/g.164606  ORF Transcript_58305/g.164606 Transcript_58305/m.164606 type:complete len:240 (+) Transcript_58305:1305-2024(+)